MDTAQETRPAASNPVEATTTAAAKRSDHAQGYAKPSTFLLPHPRTQDRAMPDKPLTALDIDQQQGIVRSTLCPALSV